MATQTKIRIARFTLINALNAAKAQYLADAETQTENVDSHLFDQFNRQAAEVERLASDIEQADAIDLFD